MRSLLSLVLAVLFLEEVRAEEAEPAPSRQASFVLNAAGDVALPNNHYNGQLNRQAESLFQDVRPLLEMGDLNFVNIEAAVTRRSPTSSNKYAFVMPPERLGWVVNAGFNVFSLANNHINDAGSRGIRDTIETIKELSTGERPIYWSGVSVDSDPDQRYQPTIIETAGLRIALFCLGFENSSSSLEAKSPVHQVRDTRYVEVIAGLKETVDLIWVSSHFGKEYHHIPGPDAIRLYREFVDAGADLVIGHHPHVIRGIEKYNDGFIIHSLGNFAFGSKTTRHRATGAKLYSKLVQVVYRGKEIDSMKIFPLYVNNLEGWRYKGSYQSPANFGPVLLKGVFAEKVLADLDRWCREIENNPVRIQMEGETGKVVW